MALIGLSYPTPKFCCYTTLRNNFGNFGIANCPIFLHLPVLARMNELLCLWQKNRGIKPTLTVILCLLFDCDSTETIAVSFELNELD